MKAFAAFIVKNRRLVLLLTLLLVVASVAGIVYTVVGGKINSDLFVYLPENSNTVAGLAFMEKTFGIKGDAMMVVEGDKDDPELQKLVNKIKATEGVSQFIWVGDMWQADKMLSIVNGDSFKLYEILGGKIDYDVSEMVDFLYQPVDENDPNGKYNYVMLGMLDYSASTVEAKNLLSEITSTFSDSGRAVVATGMTNTSADVMYKILGEMPYYILFALLAVIVILLLTTDSFVDPIVLLVTLGVSIIISMGTNLVFGNVSIISFALSSVLQLAVTMDYAIFYMHLYKEKRAGMDCATAAVEAAPNVWSSILASCLTTVGGFFALFFMQFTLGADLGKVLVKAVLTSLLCVMILQPVLTVLLDRAEQKTRHPSLKLKFNHTSEFVVNKRNVFVALAALLILPAFVLQNFTDYSYFKVFDEPENPTSQQVLADQIYNQLVICVPVVPDRGTHQELIAELKAMDQVDYVIGAFSIMQIAPEKIEVMLANEEAKEFAGDYVSNFFGEAEVDGKKELYTMYTVVISGADEDAESRSTYYRIREIADKYFDDFTTMGMLTGVTDMAAITPTDFLIVSGVSIAVILVVLLLMLLSIRQSVLLVALIELSIWLNLAFSMLIGQSLNFMVYIIISSVQLGCTVDYAILMSSRYREFYIKLLGDRKAAAKAAAKSSLSAISVSASIIISVCLAVYFVSGNMIVQQMTGLLARGAFIAYVLVMFVLPGLLTYTKPTVTKHLRMEFEPPKPIKKSKEYPYLVRNVGEAKLVVTTPENDRIVVLQNAETYGIIDK